MTKINIYLTFNGNCEEAFNFYKSVLGGKLEMNKFKDMPADPKVSISDADKEKVMHATLQINNELGLMASDTGGEWASKFKQGNNFSISLNVDSKEEADRQFAGLSKNGQVMMPMNKTFWGAYFGMLTDKFGIQWMVSF